MGEGEESPYKTMTTFLVEKEPGFGETAPGLTIPGKIDKMGYKGVDTTEAVFENHQISADQILGGETGQGFYQMMDGVEVGRVNVAARACGIANRAFELAIAYSQQRETFGKPIAEHQAILFRLAEMATKVETAHAMMVRAARMKDSGERNDVEAGMAKMLASEYCNEVVQDSFRIHGGYGYSKEYEIERLYREAAFMLIGEGTSDIQKMIIGRALLKDYSGGRVESLRACSRAGACRGPRLGRCLAAQPRPLTHSRHGPDLGVPRRPACSHDSRSVPSSVIPSRVGHRAAGRCSRARSATRRGACRVRRTPSRASR